MAHSSLITFFSETTFVARPDGITETDGVLMSVWHPLEETNKPLLQILEPLTLSLIAELELPVSFLPAALHGLFYQME